MPVTCETVTWNARPTLFEQTASELCLALVAGALSAGTGGTLLVHTTCCMRVAWGYQAPVACHRVARDQA